MKKIKFSAIIALTAIITFTSCSKKSADQDSTPPSAITTFNAVSPARALPNSIVSLKGTNFITDISKINVTFNGTAATVYAATATEITVGVPVNATSGKVVLTANGASLTSTTDFTVTSGIQTTYAKYATGGFEYLGFDVAGNGYGDGWADGPGIFYGVILKITTDKVISPVAGGGPATSNPFKNVWGSAVDPAGNVYVVDRAKYQIVKIATNGTISTLAGSGTSGFADATGTDAKFVAPLGLAIDAAGNLYTNDATRVRKITPAGVVTTLAGGATAGYADGTGSAALIGMAEGIAVDGAGNVYIDDNKSVRKITPAGVVTTLAGNGTAGITDGQGKAAQFYSPEGMAVDAAGNIFVSDNMVLGGSRDLTTFSVRMVNKLGFVTTFIKTVYAANATHTILNGPIGTATVCYPDGITFDAKGDMYICNRNFPGCKWNK